MTNEPYKNIKILLKPRVKVLFHCSSEQNNVCIATINLPPILVVIYIYIYIYIVAQLSKEIKHLPRYTNNSLKTFIKS